MRKIEIVNPNLSNFVKSLRDIGYTFEIAVADILDNSITAKSSNIKIYTVSEPELIFALLDDGLGMAEIELIEGMRIASKNPDSEREKSDLGRFGLGLKTASFSQCRVLTVISKKNEIISSKQWDLDFISQNNEWSLITPDIKDLENLPFLEELKKQSSGTLVIWQKIDKYKKENFHNEIDKLKKHLSLVFHRFLERSDNFRSFKITINNDKLKPFNPFNEVNTHTQAISPEKIRSNIIVQPFILPHPSNVSQQEYEQYSTDEGYTKSQGFYLYRENRLLIYGTWWGLHKAIDAHKLVRIKIDISNDQDKYWGIDIKKSTAKPLEEIKKDLQRIIRNVVEKGSKPFTGRGKKIHDKTINRFWELVPTNENFRFSLNYNHPIYEKLLESCTDKELLNTYLKSIEAYLPLDAIQSKLQLEPHKIKQSDSLSEEEIILLAEKLKLSGLSENYIESLLKTEIFKNRKELFDNE